MGHFKVNDWVKIPEDQERSLAQIKELFEENSMKAKLYWPSEKATAVCLEMQDYVAWVPESGEWCWFWLDETKSMHNYLSLGKFIGFRSKETHELFIDYYDTDNNIFSSDMCAPFIGALPYNLKDLK